MKNLMKLGMALLIAAMVLGFGGCFEPEDDDAIKSATSHIDFGSYSGVDRSLLFSNNSSKPVILFKGELYEGNIIGGVPANTYGGQGHGIRKNPQFFSQTEAFKVIVLSEDQYVNNKGNLAAIQYPFTTLYAFYNSTGDNQNIYNINGLLGSGDYYIEVLVPQGGSWNVEIREGGTNHPAIGYAAAGSFTTRIYVQPDREMHLFPVFHRWNTFRDVLETVFPKDVSGGAVYIFKTLTTDDKIATLTMKTYLDELKNHPPNVGAAYVVIDSQVQNTDIQLIRNGEPVRNSMGLSGIPSSKPKTFQIQMAEITAGNFQSTASFYGYTIGMPGNGRPIKVLTDVSPDTPVTPTSITLDDGYIYQIVVTGTNMDPNNISPVMDMRTSKVTQIQWSDDQGSQLPQ